MMMEYEAGSSLSPPSLDEDTIWRMNLRSNESMESGPFPEHPGEPDCTYYIRTGLCRFGMTCRFNHPPNRKLAIATARIQGGYPERIGQPECQTFLAFFDVSPKAVSIGSGNSSRGPSCLYYLKTGTCKFGATCKFHHPRDKAGIAGRALLNILGHPLRPNETECPYYLRTGQCKFGNTCKFHHPQPSSAMVSLRQSPVYPTVQSPTSPSQQSYSGGVPTWALPRASFIPSPRWQGPSNYTQLILPQGVVPVPGRSAYTEHMASVASSESQKQTPGNNQFYGTSIQSETTNAGSQGTFSSLRLGSVPTGIYALQRENIFPERPGQPECQFYIKTSDCKFGAVCRFHHPRERMTPVPNCMLSPLGLPLRPGEPLCIFYSRYGICKFGPNCKFDHPMGKFAFGLTTTASADIPIVRRMLESSSGTMAVSLTSEGSVEAGSGNSRRLPLSKARQMPSDEEDVDPEG